MSLLDKLKQVAIAFDQLLNTIRGLFWGAEGFADETLSAYFWRRQDRHPYAWQIVDAIFFFDPQHCYESYKSELIRSQLPVEYR